MTILEFWYVASRYRWLLLTLPLALVVVVVVVTAMQPRRYSATVVMIPASLMEDAAFGSKLGGPLGSLLGVGGLNASVGAAKSEAIAVLKSRKFTEAFVQDRKLLPVLFPDLWDAAGQRWNVESANEAPTLQDAFQLFERTIRFVRDDEATGLVTLEIIWFDRKQAASWAADLVARVNRSTRDRVIAETERNIAYLHRQLEVATDVDLRRSIVDLLQKNINKLTLARGREDFAFRIVDPAIPSDADRPVSPQLILRAAIAAVLGALLALMMAFAHFFLRQARAASVSEPR
jgi:hypothetical protein